jgi:hypothetical protein
MGFEYLLARYTRFISVQSNLCFSVAPSEGAVVGSARELGSKDIEAAEFSQRASTYNA